MMNKRIRSMIDDIFAEMKMTAENLALRDELMANAQARYEDAVGQGKSEEEAFAEVAASLGDVHALLREMNGAAEETAEETAEEPSKETEKEAEADVRDENGGEAGESAKADLDLGDALNKAFTVLGDFGQSIMPQAKKLVRQVDDATGGMIVELGKAVNKGVRDAQKTAGEAIDKFKKAEEQAQPEQPAAEGVQKTPAQLREEAKDLLAQAALKEVSGDAESAQALRAQAAALETQADVIEQAQAMAEAQQAAAEEAEGAAPQEPEQPAAEPLVSEDGEVNEEAFARAVDDMTRQAEEAAREAEEKDAEYTVREEPQAHTGGKLFPAAGLRRIDIKLDADDVRIEPGEGTMIETIWTARNVEGEPVIALEDHTLTIRRRNPDVFKTFFSVFSKDGGQITVRVPRGYAADYVIGTTSGDIAVGGIDVDDVSVNTTSGAVRIEPDANVRARQIDVNTVSGSATVSACAGEVDVNTVSGSLFVSCDADKVDVNTVSGRVHIEGNCSEWEANSVSGEIEMLCTVAPTHKIEIGTMSGSARVALPGEIRGFVAELSSMSGSITNEFGPNRFGTCALPIHMETMSGSLMITRL